MAETFSQMVTNLSPTKRKNAERMPSSKNFLVEKNLGVSFGIMANLWIRGAAGHNTNCTHLRRKNPYKGCSSKNWGVFTPPSLCKLIAGMVTSNDPTEGEWLAEPAAGFGGMMLADWEEWDGLNKPIGSRYYAAAELSPRTARACWLGMVIQQMAGYVDNMNSLSMERFAPRWFTPQMLICMKFKTEGHEKALTIN